MTIRRTVALVAACMLLFSLASSAGAYIGQAPVQVLLSGPGRVVRCDRRATVTATVVDVETGEKVRQQVVKWAIVQSQSGQDSLSSLETVTNSKGKTSVKLSFGPVAGARRVSATVTIVSPSLEIRCAGGLPQTSTLPPMGVPQDATPDVAAPPRGSSVDPGVAADRVRIGRIGMDVPIVPGDGVTVPTDAAAHYAGSAWPDAGSNTYLYAHARAGLFEPLWQVRNGDVVDLDLVDGTTVAYRVTRILPLVPWDALEFLAPTTTEQVTLQTCLTYDEHAPRFIVIAERVATAGT